VSDASAAPTFKACDTQRGSNWSVLVTWPDAREQYLDGFQTFDETVAWVSHKSLAWLEAQQIHACPSTPRRHDHVWSRFETPMSPQAAPSETSNTNAPELRNIAAIDQLINVIDTHRDSSKDDRKARGESFKVELGSE
jgi:hypothetical protein